MFKPIKKVASTGFLALVLSGCVGASERPLIHQDVLSKKVISNEQSTINRKKLVTLLVENFAIQDYLDMAKIISKDNDETFSKCVIANDTYRRTESVIQEDLFRAISSLTDSEVIQYTTYLKKDDAHLFKRFNKSIYSAAETAYLADSGSMAGEIISFYQGLNTKDISYLMAVSNLPNESVRTVLFPLDFPNINLTLASESISNMKEVVESSCQ